MIYGFNKEEFMNQPVFATIEQDTMEAIGPRGDIIHPFVGEQTIVIHVGGQDYDVRELVWKLESQEMEIYILKDKIEYLMVEIHNLNMRLAAQENRVF